MIEVSIDALTPGSTTAKAVVTPSGMTLVGAGTALGATLIGRLRAMGVASVFIVGESSATPTLTVEERLQALAARFSPHAADPVMMQIHDAFAEQIRATNGNH